MTISTSVRRRLVFVKMLHDTANEQLDKPEPVCYQSILSVHDAVELFLYVSAEHLDAGISTKTRFMNYWEPISSSLPSDQSLSHKETMNRLNSARNNLKHRGNLPNRNDISSFVLQSLNFFDENTPKIFDISYKDISRIELVPFENTKQYLKEAENHMELGEYEKSIQRSAKAFFELETEVDGTSKGRYGYLSPIYANSDPIEALFSPYVDLRTDDPPSEDLTNFWADFNEVESSVSEVKDVLIDHHNMLQHMEVALQALTWDIDYPRFSRFQYIIPKDTSKKQDESRASNKVDDEFCNASDSQFCLELVLEAALNYQN